ncbi:hypothetical protein M427DRAFT_44765 [Gonapodya prolifera JEL478]|uniref:Secreted protein n=1 Tax=Gonapodya prolifera (strain JEL478) TaxID=1344416 RepID=A0A139AD97_GONPJ|nr:hypothetical protein M427DRAFT_44765 [Gonapodya prolifera JEL478]|eukprot:KXS14771.1 hypothetical protein M427DRAFT_44765 [Gonapodya prolifera JEL478]
MRVLVLLLLALFTASPAPSEVVHAQFGCTGLINKGTHSLRPHMAIPVHNGHRAVGSSCEPVERHERSFSVVVSRSAVPHGDAAGTAGDVMGAHLRPADALAQTCVAQGGGSPQRLQGPQPGRVYGLQVL